MDPGAPGRRRRRPRRRAAWPRAHPTPPGPPIPAGRSRRRPRPTRRQPRASQKPSVRGTSTPRWFSTDRRPALIAGVPPARPLPARSAMPWRPRWRNPRNVRPVGTMGEPGDGDLHDPEPGSDRVDRHRRLHPEPAGERTDGGEAARRDRSLPGQRGLGPVVREQPDGRGRSPLHRPHAAARLRREHRDRHVGAPGHHHVEQRAETFGAGAQVGVGEQPHVGRGQPVERALHGAALPGVTGDPQHRGPGRERRRGRGVGRAVVHDDDVVDGERPERLHRVGPRCPPRRGPGRGRRP